jgi:hypothetical protein
MRLARVTVTASLAFASAAVVAVPARAAASDPAPVNAAVEGCINQTVFNGTWRVRVIKVEPVHRKAAPDMGMPNTGWGVSMRWTNATTMDRDLVKTGAGLFSLSFRSGRGVSHEYAYSAELAGKDQYARYTTDEDQTGYDQLFYPPAHPKGVFSPGATREGQLRFWYPANDPSFSGRPTKLVVHRMDYSGAGFTPMRFNLKCAK